MYLILCVYRLLPPVSEGWRRYCFHRCLSVHTCGEYHGLWSQVPSSLWSHGVWGWGNPSLRVFPLSLVPGPFQGYPSPRLGGGQSQVEVPQSQAEDTPFLGYPPARTRLGYPLVGIGPPPPPRQSSRASTHYTVVTQEDFVDVHFDFLIF